MQRRHTQRASLIQTERELYQKELPNKGVQSIKNPNDGGMFQIVLLRTVFWILTSAIVVDLIQVPDKVLGDWLGSRETEVPGGTPVPVLLTL